VKKALLFLLILAATGGFVFSADLMDYPESLNGGNFLVDTGLGWAFTSGSGATMNTSIKVPPIVFNAEYCLPSVPISLGCLVGVYQYDWRHSAINTPWLESWTYATFGARVNWHWNIGVSWFDLYTGAFIGYTYSSWSVDSTPYEINIKQTYGGIDFGGQVGAHFYFAKNLGAVAEWGYPFVTKAGFALKF